MTVLLIAHLVCFMAVISMCKILIKFTIVDRVHIKGIIRERTDKGKLVLPKDTTSKLTFTVSDSRNNIIIKSRAGAVLLFFLTLYIVC